MAKLPFGATFSDYLSTRMRQIVSATLLVLAVVAATAGMGVRTVNIGRQVWMAENMNVETTGSWCYENEPENCAKYGRLYTWEAAMRVCPNGWHLPTDEEWKELERTLGLTREEADATKGRGTTVANKLKPGGQSGFAVQWGGYFPPEAQKFHRAGEVATYWTATAAKNGVWHRDVDRNTTKIWRSTVLKETGCSVRCVQDAPTKSRAE
jgi:uncharacterized protein (TIGR02145 family)